MARLMAYAEVVTTESTLMKAYRAGVVKAPPGMLLRELLLYTDEDGNYPMDLPPRFRQEITEVAQLTGDKRLLDLAKETTLPISISHLLTAEVDPDTTRVVLGHRLEYTADESQRLRGTHASPPYDPRRTFHE